MRPMRIMIVALVVTLLLLVVEGIDTNDVYSPCLDSKIQRSDGFTFGVAFSSKESFFQDQIQFSPCDTRLSLASKMAQLVVFRPKVDQLSFLTINSSTFNPALNGGYMVAFAGQKYAARSLPVLEFQRGILQNLFWKKFGCDKCSGDFSLCVDNQDCAIPNSKCKYNGGSVDCNLGIQLAFSGTDKNLEVLNSWYEVDNLRRFSLYQLFSDVRDTVTNPFG
uniref:Expp1 protein n=1 Tax=Cucumis sativus TaxID=3659 RepID=A0A0A0LIV3_CUCSA